MLAKTEGGLRFLCFAAILLSSGGADLESAELLENFLNRRSSTEQARPTLLQLLALLRAIEPKLVDAGFLKVALGWRDWCVANGLPELQGLLSYRRRLVVPLSTGVCDFVIALSQSYQVEENGGSVRVECSMILFPWVIATVNWMLGSPPNVWRSDGSQLLQSGLAGVSIVEHHGEETNGYFRISRLRAVDSLDQRFFTGDQKLLAASTRRGMLDRQTWLKCHLQMAKLHLSRCRQLVDMVTKHIGDIIIQNIQCITMAIFEPKIRDTPMAALRANAFQGLGNRLSGVRQISNGNLDLPQEGPDMETLLENTEEWIAVIHAFVANIKMLMARTQPGPFRPSWEDSLRMSWLWSLCDRAYGSTISHVICMSQHKSWNFSMNQLSTILKPQPTPFEVPQIGRH